MQALHHVEPFDCGVPALDNWLRRHALQSQRADAARTFVLCDAERVVGYYALSVGSVDFSHAPERISKGLARHPVPVMVLARLAVDRVYQRHGIGRGLVRDAILRTLQAAEFAGIRAILVHAKNDQLTGFYQRIDFEPSPLDPLVLMLLLKDARRTIEIMAR